MPRRKTFRKRRRRRGGTRRKKKAFSRSSTYKNSSPSPLGNRMKMNLNYSESTISLNSGAGTLADFVFSANGLFDPSITGTGHQPLGFDQIMAMYDHYVVIASSIKVTFVNTDPTNVIICGVSVTDSVTALVSAPKVIENGSGKYVVLGPLGSSSDTKVITLNINPNKFLGRSHPMSDPELKGDAAGNPTEGAFFHVWSGSVEGADAGLIQASTMLKYTAMFIEPVQLDLS